MMKHQPKPEKTRFIFDEALISKPIPDEEMKNDYTKPWPSLDSYLKVMTNLSIESFFKPLRIYLDQLRNNQLDPRDLYLYKNVHISTFYQSKTNFEHDVFIDFEIRGPTYSEDGRIIEYDWNVNWEYTERLRKRSLLIFSSSPYMETIEAVAFSCADHGSIVDNRVEIVFLQGGLQLSQNYYMFEPTSYWNDVLLNNLLNTNESTIPNWIINPFVHLKFPDFNLVDKDDEQLKKMTILDDEQFEAFKFCLNNKLTLVNGAPGTGKSYLGREIVKYLIKSEYKYPIVLVTYKNISLDSFLDKMSGFLRKFNVPFIRIGGILKTKNKLIKDNDYLPKIPLEIQKMKQKLMFINSLIIISNSSWYNILNGQGINFDNGNNNNNNNVFNVFINEIDKLINIRKMMFNKYKFYSKNDELLITNFFYHNYCIHEAKDFSLCFACNGNNQQFVSKYHSKVLNDCYKLLDNLQKFFINKGQGIYTNETNNIVKNHFSNDRDALYNFLFDYNHKLFPQNENEKNRDISILFDIIKQSDFNTDDLEDEGDNERIVPSFEFGSGFIEYIQKEFQKLMNSQLDTNAFIAFLADLNRFFINQKNSLEEAIKKEMKIFEEEEPERLSQILKGKKLIAITATRAAQFKESLDKSNCKFMIVEEAGELSEPLLFSIIPKTIEQIIMIGDYNQLRPIVYQELAKKPFNHNISLFEKEVRYAKDNKLPNLFTLSIQRRMHPEISSLVRSIFYNDNKDYEKLVDHECIQNLDKPNGLPNHLQFWVHEYNEKPPDDFERSYVNTEEAKICVHLFLMMLCRGYKSSEITILASCKGQKKEIIKELKSLIDTYYDINSKYDEYDAFDFENDFTDDYRVANLRINKKAEFRRLIEIRKKLTQNIVKCIDDFQGEENEVIILSLTRSTDVGSLRERNRSLVSLSRAKQMEIVVGNRNMFGTNSDHYLWRKISSQLKYINPKNHPKNGISINACQKHAKYKDSVKTIYELDDLLKYRFNLCQRYCDSFLDCNHQCQLTCHDHRSRKQNIQELFERRYYCTMFCKKKCNEGHECSGMCGECGRFGCPRCKQCAKPNSGKK